MGGESARPRLRWPLRVTEELYDGVLIVVVAGRLSHASAGALNTALEQAIDRGHQELVIDFAHVDYVSSAGLMAIERAATHLAHIDGLLVLCCVAEPVRLALDLAGLLAHMPIDPSREHAAARVTARRAGR